MSFSETIRKLDCTGGWRPVIEGLKSYLDDIGFLGLYKYLATTRQYHLNPSVLSNRNRSYLNSLAGLRGDGFPDWTLARCLSMHQAGEVRDLTPQERRVAESMAEIGMLDIKDGELNPRDFQLIAVGDRYLLLDAAIHFPLGRSHEIYLGIDSLILLHYISRTKRQEKMLDLCCGTGVVGLAMTTLADQVVSTDIFPAALTLSAMNAALNGMEDRIEIRNEPLERTLNSGERYDVVACNPPFVALPSEYNPPLFAAGVGPDGLDYLRLLLEKAPDMLNPGGEALFIADLVGNGQEPHLFGEIEHLSQTRGLRVEAYVDGRVEAELQIGPLAEYFAALNPWAKPEDINIRLRRLIVKELGATHYYMTTLRVRTASRGEFHRFNRYAQRRFDDLFSAMTPA